MKFGRIVTLALCAQGVSTAYSVQRAFRPPSPSEEGGERTELKETGRVECVRCTREYSLSQVVRKMYSGGGVDRNMLCESVSYEGPVFVSRGEDEVVEAYRALRFMKPEIAEDVRVEKEPGTEGVYRARLSTFYFDRKVVLPSSLMIHLTADGRVQKKFIDGTTTPS
eukprot:CAMPEP_0119123692 /NCGR_PEP_ID=MMETSP1310-20130426/3561_1 /TAXON_ID=464262 /ORGANISM="Genus nov. species nov., Strain RCC2339" /LENGTH=166 /DNA_ID=CAMNT_0007113549 /DNA_START=77 /DNA_END=578 /DNA_ORIENTATION=-